MHEAEMILNPTNLTIQSGYVRNLAYYPQEGERPAMLKFVLQQPRMAKNEKIKWLHKEVVFYGMKAIRESDTDIGIIDGDYVILQGKEQDKYEMEPGARWMPETRIIGVHIKLAYQIKRKIPVPELPSSQANKNEEGEEHGKKS
jgi:hypothetical protein